MKKNYNTYAQQLAAIIDIAIKCYQEFPPEGYTEVILEHVIKTNLKRKEMALHPEPQFKKIASLNYLKNDALTYFHEGSGKTVEEFWKAIKLNHIDLKRENIFEKIVKRGKIKNMIEYDTIIDLYNQYLGEEGSLQGEQYKINEMIAEFENRKSKK